MKVLNFYKDDVTGAVYIGREGPYGNPFIVGRDGTREVVIKKFREWLLQRPELIEKMRRDLLGKNLYCYCKPKPCHGDVIIELIGGTPGDERTDSGSVPQP